MEDLAVFFKSILVHILVKTVDEFKGMNPKDVVDCIEGTPHISTVPVEPGLTNAASKKNGERLVGFNTENEEINEGLVRFDIVFYVRMLDGLSQIIINVEAQKDEPKGNLDLLNIIMLGLAKNLPEHDETYELHRLLGALLSKELTIDEKLNIIGNEYELYNGLQIRSRFYSFVHDFWPCPGFIHGFSGFGKIHQKQSNRCSYIY